jgi:hypothetical protein
MLHGFQNLLVVILATLRATFDGEDAHPLFPQHPYD